MNRILDKLLGLAVTAMTVFHIVVSGLLFAIAVLGAGVARMTASAAAVLGDNSIEEVVAHILGYTDSEDGEDVEDTQSDEIPEFGVYYVRQRASGSIAIVVAVTVATARQIAEYEFGWRDPVCRRIGSSDADMEVGVLVPPQFGPRRHAEVVKSNAVAVIENEDEGEQPSLGLYCVEHCRKLKSMIIAAATPEAAKLIAGSIDPTEEWHNSRCECFGRAEYHSDKPWSAPGVHPGLLWRVAHYSSMCLFYANASLDKPRLVVVAKDEAAAKALANAVTPTDDWALFEWVGYALTGTSPGVLYATNAVAMTEDEAGQLSE